jgi:hypothetical protein
MNIAESITKSSNKEYGNSPTNDQQQKQSTSAFQPPKSTP